MSTWTQISPFSYRGEHLGLEIRVLSKRVGSGEKAFDGWFVAIKALNHGEPTLNVFVDVGPILSLQKAKALGHAVAASLQEIHPELPR